VYLFYFSYSQYIATAWALSIKKAGWVINEGEVRAQFRILGDNVKGDVAKIQGDIQSQMKQSGAGTPLSKVASDMDKNMASSLERAVGRKGAFSSTSEAFKKLNPDLFKGGGGGGSGGGLAAAASGFGGKRKEPPILAELKAKMDMDRSKFIKDATFAMMPLFNPTSVWGNLFATRQIFSGLSQTKTGQSIVGKFGMGTGTAATAAVAGGTVGVLLAVGLAIKGLAKVMQESIKAYIEAPKLYAKAMTSGLGLKFVTKRSMLAEIMGVSETEVIKYGAAFSYLNPKIEWASAIMARTNQNLTSVGWSFKIVGNDMKALFSDIANDAAPAMRKFLSGFSDFVKAVDDWYERHKTGIGRMASFYFKWNPITGLPMAIAEHFTPKGEDPGAAPQPLSFMKQLPASAWEHMGLVIGGAGGNSPAERTARATKETAEYLKAVYAMIARNQAREANGTMFSPAQSYQ
jgi:hypothetical protein